MRLDIHNPRGYYFQVSHHGVRGMYHSAAAAALPTELDDGGIIATAREVLAVEAQGLHALSQSLNGDFEQAVRTISAAAGHVVVTGMGKSGHVGRKIAATLASTGTPAFFLHPGEASHGDLGMVTPANVILALSNSGETAELSDLVVYAKRFAVKLIAITSAAKSTLAREADIALVLPPIEEACPLGLAPTSSTTMTLVMGDALAIALLRLKGFTRDNFRVFHPGGKLGSVLRRVQDIMHTAEHMPILSIGTPMSQVLIDMSAGGFGCSGVVDGDGRLVGIVTDGDLRRHMSNGILDLSVEQVMTAEPKTIDADALAAEALQIMNDCKITGLFILRDRCPIGFVHLHDCLRAGVY